MLMHLLRIMPLLLLLLLEVASISISAVVHDG